MVVDCAAVETGCMLETQVKVASKYLFFFFGLCGAAVRAAAVA